MIASLILTSACSFGSHPAPQPAPRRQDDTPQEEASQESGWWGVSAGTSALPDSGARVSNSGSAPTRPSGSPARSSRRSSKQSSARGSLSYSYLQFDLLSADNSPSEIEMDGFGFLGSIELGDNLFAFAGLSKAEADVLYSDGGFFGLGTLQEDSKTIGLGAHFPISDVADVFGTARYSHYEVELDVPGFGIFQGDSDYMSYGIGARFLATDALELSLQFEQNNASGSEVDTRQMSLGARYHLNDQLAFQILYGSLEPTEGTGETDIFNFGLSYFF